MNDLLTPISFKLVWLLFKKKKKKKDLYKKNVNCSPFNKSQCQEEEMLHYGKHGPVQTILRPVADITFWNELILCIMLYIFSV